MHQNKHLQIFNALALLLTLVITATAAAQQATLLPSATQPSAGVTGLRQTLAYETFDVAGVPGGFDDTTLTTNLTFGLTPSVALSFDLPVRYRASDVGPDAFGLTDATAAVRWRFYQNDFGPLDTTRLAVVAGVRAPTGDAAFSSGGFDPVAAFALTHIQGRHGVGGFAGWTFATAGDDAPSRRFATGRYDAGELGANYLFRITPATFDAARSGGAWYAVAETLLRYETNGNVTLDLAPGLLFEGSNVAFELSVALPVVWDVSGAAERELGVVAGVRFLF